MYEKLIDKLLKRITYVTIPNNPRNKKEEKKEKKYLFTSTEFVYKKDDAGVVHLLIKGTICKRNPPKPPSKRDLHRMKGKK